jgi:uncharacterized protein YegP (UPF0339 family)
MQKALSTSRAVHFYKSGRGLELRSKPGRLTRERWRLRGSMFFEIYKSGENGTYWWEAKTEDDKTMCSSEPMPSKETCVAAILILKHGVSSANVYDETGERSGPIKARRISV